MSGKHRSPFAAAFLGVFLLQGLLVPVSSPATEYESKRPHFEISLSSDGQRIGRLSIRFERKCSDGSIERVHLRFPNFFRVIDAYSVVYRPGQFSYQQNPRDLPYGERFEIYRNLGGVIRNDYVYGFFRERSEFGFGPAFSKRRYCWTSFGRGEGVGNRIYFLARAI